jgi:UrcA family protein
MKASTMTLHPNIRRGRMSVALVIGALTLMSVGAQAAHLDPITLSPPVVKPVARDPVTEIPIDDVTVRARIDVDTETLRNDSGVVLLKDRVLEAAHEACDAADPFMGDDGTCVRDAVKAAQPQVDAAIANARSSGAME